MFSPFHVLRSTAFAGILLGSSVVNAGVGEWATRFNGLGNSSDYAASVACDGFGNTYVTGEATNADGNYDILTVKYDVSGTRLWSKRYDGPGKGNDTGVKVALDPVGNVYVAGYVTTLTGSAFAVFKYSPDGVKLWSRFDDGAAGSNSVAGMAVDLAGNVVVTGDTYEESTGHDYWTLEYSSAGDLMWVNRYSGDGGFTTETPYAIAVDSAGNTVVTGSAYTTATGGDTVTIKYASEGRVLWTRRHSGGSGTGNDGPAAIATDLYGNVVVFGIDDHTAKGTSFDWCLLKYDPAGNLLWQRGYNAPANNVDAASGLGIDLAGNIFVTGSSIGPTGTIDWCTARYSPDGSRQWMTRFNGTAGANDFANAIAVDAGGDVTVTGLENSGMSSATWNAVTVKYTPDGKKVWIHRYGATNGRMDVGNAIATDPFGNVGVAGTTDSGTRGTDYLILRYAS